MEHDSALLGRIGILHECFESQTDEESVALCSFAGRFEVSKLRFVEIVNVYMCQEASDSKREVLCG